MDETNRRKKVKVETQREVDRKKTRRRMREN